MKKSIFYQLIYGNRIILVCILFTVATMLDLILSVMAGVYEDTYAHLANRFILCVLASFGLLVFRYFPKLPLMVVFCFHFFIALATQLIHTWLIGFFVELHPDAYFYAIRTIFIIYPVVVIGSLMIDLFQTMRANRILKKLK